MGPPDLVTSPNLLVRTREKRAAGHPSGVLREQKGLSPAVLSETKYWVSWIDLLWLFSIIPVSLVF